MAPNAVTIPLLPCPSVDEITDFYRMLGFNVTYRQKRPNPYAALQFGEIELHFFGIPDFDPEQSYGSCIVNVPDTGELFETFADGMRSAHGKLLLAGIPRITRPRKRKNTGNAAGFTVVDPGGNWIRIFRMNKTPTPEGTGEEVQGSLARTLQNAIVLGESKGDHQQAAKILDATLAKSDDTSPAPDRVEALVYRAELAIRLDKPAEAQQLLDRVRELTLDDSQQAHVADALANAAELGHVVRAQSASS